MNLSRFDLLSIRLGLYCIQTGSLSQAARLCHLALAAASRRIRELEDALGLALFERHSRGLRPTRAGRVFARHALDLMQTADRLSGDMLDLKSGVTQHIQLCSSTAAINQFLPGLLALHANVYPQYHVDLEEQVSAEVVRTLREGRADVGIFVEGADTTDLQPQLFREDELVVVMPRGHALAKSVRPVAFEETLDSDWIVLNTGAAALQLQQQAALALRKSLRIRMQVRSFDAVCHLVASGLGIALLPLASAKPMVRAMDLRHRPLDEIWAKRRLMLALGIGVSTEEPAVLSLTRILLAPSQNTKSHPLRKQ